MKKNLWIINLLLLIINIALFTYFSVYTILGSNPVGSYITEETLSLQLVFAIIYEFVFFTVSTIISKVLKKDLSFKGADVLRLVSKIIAILIILIGICLIIYSIVFKLGAEFLVTVIVMQFSIILEIGITKLFFINRIN